MSQATLPQSPRAAFRHFVPLETRPASLAVPADLRDRFGYDQERRALFFEGYMSKATFDRLQALGTDYCYQRALERLFQDAVPEKEAAPLGGFGLLRRFKALVPTLW